MKKNLLLFVGMIFIACFASLNVQAHKSGYKIVRIIPLIGNGGWDYLSVDEANNKLFISHSSQVNVVDLKTLDQIAVIPQTKGVHGIAIANDLNRAFISCGMDSSVLIVDLSNFNPVKRVQVTGKNPDAILYDSFSKRVFTFNGKSSNATVIDAITCKVIATIPLVGKPEFSQTDGNGKIFVNIEDKSCITEINATSLKVERVWSIAPGEEPSGLALDNKNHRLFSVCGNKMMTITDANTGNVITTVPIGSGSDGVAFDPATKRIFSSNGEGTMTVVQQVSADEYQVLENFPTRQGARTITLDKTSGHLYLPVADYVREPGQKSVEPGTFKVIEIIPVK